MKEYFETQIKPVADKLKELLKENQDNDSFINWIREPKNEQSRNS